MVWCLGDCWKKSPNFWLSSSSYICMYMCNYSGTPHKGHLSREDTSLIRTYLQGTYQVDKDSLKRGHISNEDTFLGPSGVLFKEPVPLYMYTYVRMYLPFDSVASGHKFTSFKSVKGEILVLINWQTQCIAYTHKLMNKVPKYGARNRVRTCK